MFSTCIKQKKKEMTKWNFQVFSFPNVLQKDSEFIETSWDITVKKEWENVILTLLKVTNFALIQVILNNLGKRVKSFQNFMHVLVKKKKLPQSGDIFCAMSRWLWKREEKEKDDEVLLVNAGWFWKCNHLVTLSRN